MYFAIRLAPLVGALVLAGCSTVQIDQSIKDVDQRTSSFSQGKLELQRTDEQKRSRERLTRERLSQTVSMDGAVQIALANSPQVQALLAEAWADMAAAKQSGRIANPVFTFERMRFGEELEFGRLLSFGLLDLITLPRRQSIAASREEQAKLLLAMRVVDEVRSVRQAWVRAVTAQQLLTYAGQVKDAAEASAELARRMQQVGNFSKLQRAREQVFYADATAQFASAQHASRAAREDLVQLLGLDDHQADQLQLPDRLPDLPQQPRQASDVNATALQERLDVQLAGQQLKAAGKTQGLTWVTSLVDVELGGRHDTVFDGDQRGNRNGFELGIRLPLFDFGDAQRAAMNAATLAAANRYEAIARGATSQLRSSYSAYRTAYDVAKHYRDEVVPLRQTIADENVLRYNGMLIGVFELLSEARTQINGVMAAINSQQQFWMADIDLTASQQGRTTAARAIGAGAAEEAGGDAH